LIDVTDKGMEERVPERKKKKKKEEENMVENGKCMLAAGMKCTKCRPPCFHQTFPFHPLVSYPC
jgi:hypothetical protein